MTEAEEIRMYFESTVHSMHQDIFTLSNSNYTDGIGTGYTSQDKELYLHFFKINQSNSDMLWWNVGGGGGKKVVIFSPQKE